MSARGLGKSFGSLLPDDFDQSMLLDKDERVQKISVQDISPDPNQPRRTFDAVAIDELAQSVKRHGILQPLVVTRTQDGYIIIAGERRYRAAKKAGLTHVPALVRTLEDLEKLEIGLVENMQRVDLTPYEQAMSIARLNQEFSISLQEVAKRLGKAHTTVVNTVRLLQLPDFARKALEGGKITEGHARAVLALKDSESLQKTLIKNIIDNGWSVRQAELFVTQSKSGKSTQNIIKKSPKYIQHEIKLQKRFGAKVSVKETKRGGSVSFNFKTHKELTEFIDNLK